MNNNVEFNEPGMAYSMPNTSSKQSFLTGLVLKLGLAKDAKQAQSVLIIIGILAIVVMFFAWPSGSVVEVAAPHDPLSGESPTPIVEDDLFDF